MTDPDGAPDQSRTRTTKNPPMTQRGLPAIPMTVETGDDDTAHVGTGRPQTHSKSMHQPRRCPGSMESDQRGLRRENMQDDTLEEQHSDHVDYADEDGEKRNVLMDAFLEPEISWARLWQLQEEF